MSGGEREGAQRDIFRDSPIRYLGYANEVGEAFRPLVPVRLVHISYQIAALYVLADTMDKTFKTYEKPAVQGKSKACQVVGSALDTLTWQSFASIIIPGFTINRVCALSLYALQHKTILIPGPVKRMIATGIGLVCIPFIIKPIDHFVDYAMDNTVRKISIC